MSCLTGSGEALRFVVNVTASTLPYHGGCLMVAGKHIHDGATFLIVEDDPAMRVVLRDILAGLGRLVSAPHWRRDA